MGDGELLMSGFPEQAFELQPMSLLLVTVGAFKTQPFRCDACDVHPLVDQDGAYDPELVPGFAQSLCHEGGVLLTQKFSFVGRGMPSFDSATHNGEGICFKT